MNSVSRDLSLLLFLKSKNRFKPTNKSAADSHRKDLQALYLKNCKKTRPDTQKLASVGYDISSRKPCVDKKKCTFGTRDISRIKWTPPPSYNISKEPYLSQRGDFGSYWTKIKIKAQDPFEVIAHKPKSSRNRKENIDPSMPYHKLRMRCEQHKGKIQGNVRLCKPSSRCMINDPVLCYRDPKQPGPTTYFVHKYDFSTKLPKKKRKIQQYFNFLDRSAVPVSRSYMYKKNTAHSPSSVHYENRFPKISQIPKGCTFSSDILWDIERQKRLKFRRLPHKKVKYDAHCAVEFQHIKGNGFTYLFKNIPPKREYTNHNQKFKKLISEKQTKLHADAKYLQMINYPARKMISRWSVAIHILPDDVIRFNSVTYKKKKKTMRLNKKIAFFSGCSRWKNDKRPRFLTAAQLKEIKKNLPVERRLTDYPTTTKNLEDIQSRVYDIPSKFQMECNFKKQLSFKFIKVPKIDNIFVKEEFESYLPVGDKYRACIEDFIKGNEDAKLKTISEIERLFDIEGELSSDDELLEDSDEGEEETEEDNEEGEIDADIEEFSSGTSILE